MLNRINAVINDVTKYLQLAAPHNPAYQRALKDLARIDDEIEKICSIAASLLNPEESKSLKTKEFIDLCYAAATLFDLLPQFYYKFQEHYPNFQADPVSILEKLNTVFSTLVTTGKSKCLPHGSLYYNFNNLMIAHKKIYKEFCSKFRAGSQTVSDPLNLVAAAEDKTVSERREAFMAAIEEAWKRDVFQKQNNAGRVEAKTNAPMEVKTSIAQEAVNQQSAPQQGIQQTIAHQSAVRQPIQQTIAQQFTAQQAMQQTVAQQPVPTAYPQPQPSVRPPFQNFHPQFSPGVPIQILYVPQGEINVIGNQWMMRVPMGMPPVQAQQQMRMVTSASVAKNPGTPLQVPQPMSVDTPRVSQMGFTKFQTIRPNGSVVASQPSQRSRNGL